MKNLFEAGQQIETSIVAISGDTVFLDLGLKSEGILDKAELIDELGNCSVKEGDKIKVYFVSSKNEEYRFTTKLAGQNADTSVLETAYKSGIPVEGSVKAEIKGGFEVIIGNTKAFCPYSQMGYRQRKEPAEYVGTHQIFKIQEYKNEGKNIIVSNRAILEAQANEKIDALSKSIKEGTVVEGTVKSIESYGAFIDLDGVQALLPISEISRARVSDVHEALSIGQKVKAKVIKADWTHERITVSMKELEKDPWDDVTASFKVGDRIDSKISRVTDFGIFVSLAAGIDGLVHISKLNVERNTNLKKVYKEGTDIAVIIDKIDVQEKRISLSPVVSNEEEDNAKEYLASQNDDDGETYNPFAALLKK